MRFFLLLSSWRVDWTLAYAMDFANAVTNKGLSLEPQKIFLTFFTPLLTTRFPKAGLSDIHVCTDFLLDWILAAEWSRLVTTYQVG